MSLQDDIFDVAAALEGKPEFEAFNDIAATLIGFERERDIAQDELRMLKRALATVGTYMMQKVE